jgi:hypothetical protein
MSKKSPVKFTKKFQAQARSFYNKIADLPVHEAAVQFIRWCDAPMHGSDNVGAKFFAWALAYRLDISHDVVWFDSALDDAGIYPDAVMGSCFGDFTKVPNCIRLDDVDVEDDDASTATGFACLVDGIPQDIDRPTFHDAFGKAAHLLLAHAQQHALKNHKEAKALCLALSAWADDDCNVEAEYEDEEI